LLRAVAYGESDVIATLLTESGGKLSAIVRGGRKSSRRVGGALEPFHTLVVTLLDKEDGQRSELVTMKEARIARVREGITTSLEAVDAAGRALRWARHLCPARTPEPEVWRGVNDLLDALDALASRAASAVSAVSILAVFGLKLLADTGYALELERCVSCGKPCPRGRTAEVDTSRGGVICQQCGGARTRVGGDLRALAASAQRGTQAFRLTAAELTADQTRELIALVQETMAAHAGLEPS
jgi:DNA repair protein RecO (recombination protein O)